MNPMLEKLMQLKKGKRVLPEEEVSGKMSAISKLSDLAHDDMGKKLGSLKKVTVASDSPEGLQKGLEKAKDIVSQTPTEDESLEDPAEEALETSDEEAAELEPCDEHSSLEEIDAEIERLTALKHEKEASEQA